MNDLQSEIQTMSGVNKKIQQLVRQIVNSTAIDGEKIAKENKYLLLDDINL